MNRTNDPELSCDVLIIGTEAAGAKAAIEANLAGAKVLVVTKGLMGRSGATVMAGAGVQAPLGHMDSRDNPDVFHLDMLKGGAFLNNQKLLDRLVNLANSEVPKLEKWGSVFEKTEDGKFFQSQLPGSSYPRTLRGVGGEGGVQWRKGLKAEIKRQGIVPMEDFFVTKLLTSNGEVAGAMGISLPEGRLVTIRSKITILATGGCGQLFLKTDTPATATGDGMALALDLGAELMDMEFHQFFPYHCYGPPVLAGFPVATLRYSLRAKLYNSRGEEFLERYMPLSKAWGLRDPTSRAIFIENKQRRGSPHGGAYMSVMHLPANLIRESMKFVMPRLMAKTEKVGFDLTQEALEVGPAVHYTMGGIRVNEHCESTVPRLIAVGENASGMDGAERIDGGPAITWCLTMGYIGGAEGAAKAMKLDWLPVDEGQVVAERDRLEKLLHRNQGITGFDLKEKIKNIMWEQCGLLRDKASLEEGLRLIREVKKNDLPRLSVPSSSKCYNQGLVSAIEAENMLKLAELALTSAGMREESRRSHYRTDFPVADNANWLKNIIVKQEDGRYTYTTAPPIVIKFEPPHEEISEENYG